jgi:hypothetical protein
MEILGLQEVGLPGLQPALFVQSLALWAVSIPTRVEFERYRAARVADQQVSALGSGAAGLDGPHHAQLLTREAMVLAKGVTMLAENIRDLNRPGAAAATSGG